MTPTNIETTHEVHVRHNIVLYYGNGETENEVFYGDQATAFHYADQLKTERRAQSAIVN